MESDLLLPAAMANTVNSSIWSQPVFLVGGTSASQCSFHGHVNPITQRCVCDAGWTGVSDFVNAGGAQCQIHEWSVKALWILLLVAVVIVFVRGAPHILDITYRFLDQRSRRAPNRKRLFIVDLIQNKTMMAIAFFYVMTYPAMTFMALWRLADDSGEQRLGVSVAFTVAWLFARIGIYGATACHQPNMMRFLLKAMNQTNDVIGGATVVSAGFMSLLTIAGVLVIPVLVTHGDDIVLARACFATLCGVVGFVQVLIAGHARYVMVTLDGVLKQSYEVTHQPKVLEAQSRMQLAQKSVIKASAVQIIIYWGILICPPLWICFDYIMPISFCFPAIMGWQVLISLSNIIQQRSTARGGTASRMQTAVTQVSVGAPLAEKHAFTIASQSRTDGPVSETNSANMGFEQSVLLVGDAEDPALLLLGGEFERHRESTAGTPESSRKQGA